MPAGMPGFVSPFVATPYRRPCVVVPNPEDFKHCGAAAGDEYTILGYPICAECYAAVSDETVHTSAAGVDSFILGGVPHPESERVA